MRDLPDEPVGKNTFGIYSMNIIFSLVQRSISGDDQILTGISELIHTGILGLGANEGVVTVAQRKAMEWGSIFGWDVPAANPDNYNPDGTFVK